MLGNKAVSAFWLEAFSHCSWSFGEKRCNQPVQSCWCDFTKSLGKCLRKRHASSSSTAVSVVIELLRDATSKGFLHLRLHPVRAAHAIYKSLGSTAGQRFNSWSVCAPLHAVRVAPCPCGSDCAIPAQRKPARMAGSLRSRRMALWLDGVRKVRFLEVLRFYSLIQGFGESLCAVVATLFVA